MTFNMQFTSVKQMRNAMAKLEIKPKAQAKRSAAVQDYDTDYHQHLLQMETDKPIRANYLEDQTYITPLMRATLYDWLAKVAKKLELCVSCLLKAIYMVDHFLQTVKDFKCEVLQLLGITALFVASKYVLDDGHPKIACMASLTDNAFTVNDILKMEQLVLHVQRYDLSRPTALWFLQTYESCINSPSLDKRHMLSLYLLELSGMAYELSCYKPSQMAAAALFLALQLLDDQGRQCQCRLDESRWTPQLCELTRYNVEQLLPLVRKLARLAFKAPVFNLNFVYEKYKSQRYLKASRQLVLYDGLIKTLIK